MMYTPVIWSQPWAVRQTRNVARLDLSARRHVLPPRKNRPRVFGGGSLRGVLPGRPGRPDGITAEGNTRMGTTDTAVWTGSSSSLEPTWKPQEVPRSTRDDPDSAASFPLRNPCRDGGGAAPRGPTEFWTG